MELRFTLTDEQQTLRETARRFLRTKSDTEKVRADMATPEGFDEALWKETAQMGWQAMAIPEQYGGAGYGPVEQAVLMEEMGRALFCTPYLSSAVLFATAVLEGGDEDQRQRWLPAAAAGETRGTVVLPRTLSATSVGLELRDGAVHGEVSHVLDGHTADVAVVPVDADGEVRLAVVGLDGVVATPVESLDQTRKLATLRFEGATAELLGGDADAATVIERVATAGATALANEQVGGAQQVLEMSVEYARSRKQFGRAIGSFQAVKHRCAELLVEVESAKSAAYHAARALSAGDADEIAVAVPLARSYCSEVYEDAAGASIQIHGGIGFTWEHDAHLYFKRAKSSKLLLGSPTSWRRRLADTLGL